MANKEHLKILKQGVDVWNKWRKANSIVKPNLNWADLNGADLSRADLREASLNGVFFKKADLSGARFLKAWLVGAHLHEADLRGANLNEADLSWAFLGGVDLRGAELLSANFNGAHLSKTNFTNAVFGNTIFADLDLKESRGLENTRHIMPSTIGINTISRSEGNIPISFLRGAGVPDAVINYAQSLIGSKKQYYSCFISYSNKDAELAERIYADMQNIDIRCWLASEDMKIGDRIRKRIDETIRVYDKLLIIISKDSIKSQWVEQEVETALALERKKEKRDVLFPIRSDNAVMNIDSGWPALVKNTRHIGDFTNWKNQGDYKKAFDRLVEDLNAEGKREKEVPTGEPAEDPHLSK